MRSDYLAEFFVAETLDVGFRNLDVHRTIEKVLKTGRGVKGMNWVFKSYLGTEGYTYATDFCDRVIRGL